MRMPLRDAPRGQAIANARVMNICSDIRPGKQRHQRHIQSIRQRLQCRQRRRDIGVFDPADHRSGYLRPSRKIAQRQFPFMPQPLKRLTDFTFSVVFLFHFQRCRSGYPGHEIGTASTSLPVQDSQKSIVARLIGHPLLRLDFCNHITVILFTFGGTKPVSRRFEHPQMKLNDVINLYHSPAYRT